MQYFLLKSFYQVPRSNEQSWKEFRSKHEDQFGKLKINQILEFVVYRIRKKSDFSKDEQMILFLGVDEFRRVNNHDTLRSSITSAMTHFYSQRPRTTNLKIAFTSFLPSDITETTLSGRVISYLSLIPLKLEDVKKLFHKFWNVREANRRAIVCCIGHQRALECMYQILENNSALTTENSSWKSSQSMNDGFVKNLPEKILFQKLIDELSILLSTYVKIFPLQAIEPAVTGRPIYLSEQVSPEQRMKFKDVFAHGIYVNVIPSSEDQVVSNPRTTL